MEAQVRAVVALNRATVVGRVGQVQASFCHTALEFKPVHWPARKPPLPEKCQHRRASGAVAAVSQEDWVMAGRAEYPMLLPAVKYQYTLLDSRGVFATVGVVTVANVSTAPVLKQVKVVAFLAPIKM